MYFVMLLVSWLSILLQGYSKNLIFIFISVATMLSLFSTLFYEEKRKIIYMVPSFMVNGGLLFRCIQLHQVYGSAMADYLIAAAFLVISVLLSLTALIPVPMNTPSE